MKIPCEYCGQMIPETEQTCPYCGAANKNVKRTAYGVPTTIQELRAYCEAHHLPLQDMRVFIGEDYRGAKAFGIYRDNDTGNFVVYKNKADGTRAIRYEGNDEAYAVNELYLKIKERVDIQKAHQESQKSRTPTEILMKSLTFKIIMLTMCIAFILPPALIFWGTLGPDTGYYVYQGSTWYYDHSDWYEWDDIDSEWSPASVDSELKKNYEDYYQSGNWDDDYGAGDFTDSVYYSAPEWEDDDWDYDWDDSSDWDSSYDDWDSDW